jgi:hypothetical protein
MREIHSKGARPKQRLRGFMVTGAIVIGGLLMLAGSIYGVVLQSGGPEELGEVWPLYLGGVVAILLGWMNGDLQH